MSVSNQAPLTIPTQALTSHASRTRHSLLTLNVSRNSPLTFLTIHLFTKLCAVLLQVCLIAHGIWQPCAGQYCSLFRAAYLLTDRR